MCQDTLSKAAMWLTFKKQTVQEEEISRINHVPLGHDAIMKNHVLETFIRVGKELGSTVW